MVKIKLKEKIREPTIICGFKNFGLVGNLVVNQFIKDMSFKEVGSCKLKEIPPIMTLQEGKIFKPVNFLYNEKKNILLVFIIVPTKGIEWEIAEIIEDLYEKTKAKEILIPDGIRTKSKDDVFYVSNFKDDKKLKGLGTQLENSVIMGVSAALLMDKDLPVICILGKARKGKENTIKGVRGIPSANAAANIINVLNEYLDVDINIEDLKKRAEKIEKALENFMERVDKMKKSHPSKKVKDLKYIG
jgi:uncharacterized protein